MAETFFKKFRDSNGRIISSMWKNPYGEANLPSPDTDQNTYAWQGRVAIPFSYIISDGGKRQYGTLYAPMYEADKIYRDGTVDSDELEIYGAELSDGLSMTPKGFRNLYDKFKYNDFRIESGAANAASQAAKGGELKQVSPAVPVENALFFSNLRKILNNLQKGGGA